MTVASGGFIYTGDYVHSWLAATQYIAPLMANFDTSLSNDSYVRFEDTGSKFIVVWENVSLQDKQRVGKFTFSATLHKNGDITFIYYKVPITITAIQDSMHPVKVGLSDAYIIDKMVFCKFFFFSLSCSEMYVFPCSNSFCFFFYFILVVRRKTIYEYHRVNFSEAKITSNTVLHLVALPTCLQYTDCVSCMNHNTSLDVSNFPLFLIISQYFPL